jgi:UDPglucose--hexose-1-phosphate uridylyltransferase
MFNLTTNPHRRYNPLSREWVLVSPHRTQRPWQGQVERPPREERLRYDPNCYLCPGNPRAGGVTNPEYTRTFVFTNDFSALLPDTPEGEYREGELLYARSERGICRVVCFSPRHDLTIAEMEREDIRTVVETWIEQYLDLAAKPFIGHVQIFENRGEMMGASNPHPHGQIWATEHIPLNVERELLAQAEYYAANGHSLLSDYVAVEVREGTRIVCENEHFVALVPFWAVWPFETMVVSRRAVGALPDLTPEEQAGLADILKRVTTRYDNLFEVSFPYSMGFHQRPTDGQPHPEWHLHAHYYPPLLRSATVRKFMVGYEMLGEPQRDITPESAAERLRDLPETHYLDTPAGDADERS